MSIIIEGIPELKTAFVIFQQKLFNAVTTLVDETAKEGAKQAKEFVPYDTGAMKGSIEGGITQINPMVSVEGQVGAGKDSVSRGTGSYEYSIETGNKVGIEATSNYVLDVEFNTSKKRRHGKKPYFMTNTYNFLRDLTPKKAMQILSRAVQRA